MRGIRDWLHKWSFDRGLIQNVISLYGTQFANYVLPLITIPYLTRVLGPAMWGLVAFSQAFAGYASVVIGYGFDLAASREVAQKRDSKAELANIVAGVMGTKLLLAACAVGVALAVERWVPLFRQHPLFLWTAMLWGMAQAFNIGWYYQGVERMKLVSALVVVGRTAATVGIFIIIRHPSDGWKVLGIQGAGILFAVVAATAYVYFHVPAKLPTWPLIRHSLRMGWSMFVYRGFTNLYGVGNSFILGLFSPAEAVGYYAGAEKIARALVGLLWPVHYSIYPRLSRLIHNNRPAANRLVRVSLLVLCSMGAVLSVAAFVVAPQLIRIILGKNFAPSIEVLRILSPLPLLVAGSIVLGILWMLSLGMDRQFNKMVIAAGVLNLGLAVILAPGLAQLGVAIATIVAEGALTIALYFVLQKQSLNPLVLSGKNKD